MAIIGEQLHQQTRRPVTTLIILAGVVVIGIASERSAEHIPFSGMPLRLFLGLYIVCLLGAAVTIKRGVRHPSYLLFNWTETTVLTLGVGLLIVAGGTPHSLLWLLYFSTVLHGARAALYRRFNWVMFTLAACVTAAGFVVRDDPQAAIIALALGITALYLHALFLAAADREAAIELDRERLRQRLATLAIVEERERIARDLHDGFGASLTAAIWQARRDADVPEIAAMEDRLMGCLDELGALVWATRRDDPGLMALWSHLRTRCDDLFGAEVRIDYALPADTVDTPLDSRIAIAVQFIVFEALRNCVRHAGATAVRVTAESHDDALTIEIRDDGKGFDPAAVPRGHGLKHMEERAAGAGGALEIRSRPGETVISVRVPYSASPP